MKKAIALIFVLLIVLAATAVALVTCEARSRTVKMAESAMVSGDYERARRLYNFAIERGEASVDDERVFDILTAYLDAADCFKSEEFAEGLNILDSCRYDYSSLAIVDDMDKLYSSLSDGKYADERIRALSGIINAQDYERAKSIAGEIEKLSLTDSQRDRLFALTRIITDETTSRNEGIVYYVNRGRGENIPMYFEADSESDEICRIHGGEAVEVRNFAENGFIEIYYDGNVGFVRGSALTAEKPEPPSDSEDDNDGDDEDDEDDKANDEKMKNVPVEAVSEGDTLFVLTGVNLRPEPNTDCDVIDVVPGGIEVTYLGEMENGYYLVDYNGKIGYVYSDYVQK
ncbi:MAG: SH3 domain-containing protein [Oscillospiraceae bacterium]|nr:SH3 domain-containing protein [Oscillospiraceae bacterium]